MPSHLNGALPPWSTQSGSANPLDLMWVIKLKTLKKLKERGNKISHQIKYILEMAPKRSILKINEKDFSKTLMYHSRGFITVLL